MSVKDKLDELREAISRQQSFILLSLLFDAVLIGLFSYVVFWMGYSGCWFLLLGVLLQGGFQGFKYCAKLLTTR